MMKKSSMHTAPKGKIPPRAIANAGFVYHIGSGTCLYAHTDKTARAKTIEHKTSRVIDWVSSYRKGN